MDSVAENRPTRSLYIGNLHTSVTEIMLFEKFSALGPLNFVNICRENDSNQSLGYGYVTFELTEHAQRAKEEMNFDRVKGENIRLLWTQNVPAHPQPTLQNKLKIKKMDSQIDDTDEMYTLFKNILNSNYEESDSSEDNSYLPPPIKQSESSNKKYDFNEIKDNLVHKLKALLPNNNKSIPAILNQTQQLLERENFETEESNNRCFRKIRGKTNDSFSSNVSMSRSNETKVAQSIQIKDLSRSFLSNKAKSICQPLNTMSTKGTEINENKRECVRFIPQRLREGSSCPELTFRNVYVKNFGEEMNSEDLADLFVEYGPIMNCEVMLDDEGNSRGFGFVSYERPQDAKRAVEALNGKMLRNGRQLYVSRAQKKAERLFELKKNFEKRKIERQYQGTNLYVKNLEDSVDDDQLRDMFSKFGKITSAKVMSEGNCSKGFGFVCFSTPREATKAVTEMNGTIVGTKPLYVALAQRKEDRQAHFASQCIQLLANLRMKEREEADQDGQMEEESISESVSKPVTFEDLILSEPTPPEDDISQPCLSPTIPEHGDYGSSYTDEYAHRNGDRSKETYQVDHRPNHWYPMCGPPRRKIGPTFIPDGRGPPRYNGMYDNMLPPRRNMSIRPTPVQFRGRPINHDRYVHRMDPRFSPSNSQNYHQNFSNHQYHRGMLPRPYLKEYNHPGI